MAAISQRCGHSPCSQNWIDTGDPTCVFPPGPGVEFLGETPSGARYWRVDEDVLRGDRSTIMDCTTGRPIARWECPWSRWPAMVKAFAIELDLDV